MNEYLQQTCWILIYVILKQKHCRYLVLLLPNHETTWKYMQCVPFKKEHSIQFYSNCAKVTFTVWFLPSLTLSAACFSSLSSSSFPHSLGSKPIYISCSPCTSLKALLSSLTLCHTNKEKCLKKFLLSARLQKMNWTNGESYFSKDVH